MSRNFGYVTILIGVKNHSSKRVEALLPSTLELKMGVVGRYSTERANESLFAGYGDGTRIDTKYARGLLDLQPDFSSTDGNRILNYNKEEFLDIHC